MTTSSDPVAAPTLTITIAGHPLSPNARRRSHWAVQRRDTEQFRDVAALLSKAGYHGPPLERARIHVRIIHTTARRYDPDNAVGVCKSLIDGLTVRAGGSLLVDDRDVELVVTQETGPARGVVVRVWPLQVHTPARTAAAVADNRADASEGATR